MIFCLPGVFTKKFLKRRQARLESKAKRRLVYIPPGMKKLTTHTADQHYGMSEILIDLSEEELEKQKEDFMKTLRYWYRNFFLDLLLV